MKKVIYVEGPFSVVAMPNGKFKVMKNDGTDDKLKICICDGSLTASAICHALAIVENIYA